MTSARIPRSLGRPECDPQITGAAAVVLTLRAEGCGGRGNREAETAGRRAYTIALRIILTRGIACGARMPCYCWGY
jgi:hypothetical protein